MSAERQAVKVTIGGDEFTVRSDLPPEYTQQVAAHFDRILRDIRGSLPAMEAHKVAILAGLAITDELFQARRGDRGQADRITALVEEFARLVPARRGGAGPADAG